MVEEEKNKVWRIAEHNNQLPKEFRWATPLPSAKPTMKHDQQLVLAFNYLNDFDGVSTIGMPYYIHKEKIKMDAIRSALEKRLHRRQQIQFEEQDLGGRTQEEFDLLQQVESDAEESESTVLIQQIRRLVIHFEERLEDFLFPKIPKSRKDKRIYIKEREMFGTIGYKETINALSKKVHALCKQQPTSFDLSMFAITDENDDMIITFDDAVTDAMTGNFNTAQDVVNSVTQIVMEEQIETTKRKILSRFKK